MLSENHIVIKEIEYKWLKVFFELKMSEAIWK